MIHNVNMFYEPAQDRWIVEMDGRHYGLHCGEIFELNLGSLKVPCRLELDDEWYIVIRDTRMNLHLQEIYTINI